MNIIKLKIEVPYSHSDDYALLRSDRSFDDLVLSCDSLNHKINEYFLNNESSLYLKLWNDTQSSNMTSEFKSSMFLGNVELNELERAIYDAGKKYDFLSPFFDTCFRFFVVSYQNLEVI